MISLGRSGYATDVSADGSVIVGRDNSGAALVWTAGSGFTALGFKSALAISRDGTAIVGYRKDPLDSNPFDGEDTPYIWLQGAGFVNLPKSPNAGNTYALSISDDHSVIAGYSGMLNGGNRPFRWTLAEGYQYLGTLPGMSPASDLNTTDMSGDGRIIVGGNSGGQSFIWEEGVGMKPASEYFASLGINIPNINYVGAVSKDGKTFAGTTSGGQTFVAIVPEPGISLMLVAGALTLGGRRRQDRQSQK